MRQNSGLLSATKSASRHKEASIFTLGRSALPLTAGVVPKCLPFSGEVAESSWNAKQDAIILLQRCGIFEDGNATIFRRSVHLV